MLSCWKRRKAAPHWGRSEARFMKRFFAGYNSIVITSMILGLPVLGVVVPEIMPNVVSKSEEAAFHVATP